MANFIDLPVEIRRTIYHMVILASQGAPRSQLYYKEPALTPTGLPLCLQVTHWIENEAQEAVAETRSFEAFIPGFKNPKPLEQDGTDLALFIRCAPLDRIRNLELNFRFRYDIWVHGPANAEADFYHREPYKSRSPHVQAQPVMKFYPKNLGCLKTIRLSVFVDHYPAFWAKGKDDKVAHQRIDEPLRKLVGGVEKLFSLSEQNSEREGASPIVVDLWVPDECGVYDYTYTLGEGDAGRNERILTSRVPVHVRDLPLDWWAVLLTEENTFFCSMGSVQQRRHRSSRARRLLGMASERLRIN